MQELLKRYQDLLAEVDAWFNDCVALFPRQISCHRGCSACCRGLFEISLLDAALLKQGFLTLDPVVRSECLVKAQARVDELQTLWPEFRPPYILNQLPHDDWQEMPEGDPTPCPLLSPIGACQVYAWRPLTCRLHGLPNIDLTGESFSDEWCTLNFRDQDPLREPGLRFPFREAFRREFDLLADFAERQTGKRQLELDTFIACALLIDFDLLLQS